MKILKKYRMEYVISDFNGGCAMGLNDTPNSERVHIGFFGMRNAGKSSLVNAVTGQKLSVVSDVEARLLTR